MKILIAPDKFKGSLTAPEACAAIAAGLRDVNPDISIDECPIADGGEGTVGALVSATGGRMETRRVTGPLPEMKVDAAFGFLGDGTTAVIEMAAASGLALLKPEDRNPLNTTTFGTGELIRHAINAGAKRIILGIGGSATTDAGIGAAQACGFTVLMRNGEPTSMSEPLCGRDLANVLMIKHGRGEATSGIEITVACDVISPLYGSSGAAYVFAPQKGATPEEVEWLDAQLRELAIRTGHEEEAQRPGSGAAGGLGFGMLAFFGATLKPGFELIADVVRLPERIQAADLCMTGEGRLDASSAAGKTVGGVARLCHAAGVPCIALVGSLGGGADLLLSRGLSMYFSFSKPPITLEESMRNAASLLRASAATALR